MNIALQELIELLYNDKLTQYGKRRLEEYIKKQQKEIEELKNNELDYTTIYINGVYEGKKYYKDKIRETIKHYNNELEHIKNGEEFENEEPMYYWGKVALENLLEENNAK